jgi:hypothetical protein
MYPHLFHLIVEIFEIELDQNELLANFNLNILFFLFCTDEAKTSLQLGQKKYIQTKPGKFWFK